MTAVARGPTMRPRLGSITAHDRMTAARPARLPLPIVLYFFAVLFPMAVQAGPLFLTGVRVILMVMLLPLIIKVLTGRAGRLLFTDLFMILHVLWMAVALHVNNPAQVISQIGSVGVEFLGGYLLARVYVRSREDFLAVCRGMMIMVLFTLPFALYEARTGTPLIIQTINKLPIINSLGNVNIEPRLGLQRVQGMMTHPIHYGLFCSSAISLTMLGLAGVLPSGRRLLAVAGIMLCTFLSLSSGALLPMVMQVFLFVWAAALDRTGRPWLILLALMVVAYVAIDLLSTRTPVRVFFSYAAFSSHNAYWRGIIFDWGMKNVWANPIFGIGLNDWVRPFYMYSGSMDNFWLVMAVRYGIPGFLFIAVGYAVGLAQVGRRNFTADPELARLRRAWMFTFTGITFTLCTVHIWTTIHSFTFFLFGAGMWFITARLQEADPGAGPAASPTVAATGPRYSRFPPRQRPAVTRAAYA